MVSPAAAVGGADCVRLRHPDGTQRRDLVRRRERRLRGRVGNAYRSEKDCDGAGRPPVHAASAALGLIRIRSPSPSLTQRERMLGFAHAWMLAFLLAAILAGIVIAPAALLGVVRIRPGEVVEAVCWLTLGVIGLAEVAAVF
jgi:hypothetical protein